MIFLTIFFINKANVVDLQPSKEQMILGLNFIIHDNRSVTITKDYLLISTNSQMSPIIDELTSELRAKRCNTPNNPTPTLNSQLSPLPPFPSYCKFALYHS